MPVRDPVAEVEERACVSRALSRAIAAPRESEGLFSPRADYVIVLDLHGAGQPAARSLLPIE